MIGKHKWEEGDDVDNNVDNNEDRDHNGNDDVMKKKITNRQ